MTDLIIYESGTKLNNLQRRTLARAEMAHYPDSDVFLYLISSQHIRHHRLDNGDLHHSMVDMLNIIYNVKRKGANQEFDSRTVWNDIKKGMKKRDREMWDNILHLNLPSWDDHKWYSTDTLDTGWLYYFLVGTRTPITDRIRKSGIQQINDALRGQHLSEIRALDKQIFGVGSEIQLLMQSICEPGDYDEPSYPPGGLKK